MTVRSPYDGSLVGEVAACSAARALAERSEEFARTISMESAKPLKTARIEARRAASTSGEMASQPLRAGDRVVAAS